VAGKSASPHLSFDEEIMSELSRQNPTGRFTGLADLYARCRPSYPTAAVNHIMERCGLQAGDLLVDVGCGTGISSRLFAQRGLRVIGIEPNADMRARAEREPGSATGSQPEYRDGRAEATGLPDGCAAAVVAAQAFHWFDAETALQEFHRILRPAGWAILMWNERDETDPCTAAYGAIVGGTPEAAAFERPRLRAGETLLRCPLFADARRDTFQVEQLLDEQGLVDRALSASYAPREPAQRVAQFAASLRDVFARFQKQGQVILRYQTSVFTASARI
jgi:SAM-dependent methyltransferase